MHQKVKIRSRNIFTFSEIRFIIFFKAKIRKVKLNAIRIKQRYEKENENAILILSTAVIRDFLAAKSIVLSY